MKHFEEKAIPLITKQLNGEYKVNNQALAFLSSIKQPVAVVAVAGAYRTGKSFLLNTILLNQKSAFQVGPTINPQTKGIWIWNKLAMYSNSKNQVTNAIVIDTQGLGSTEQDINHDLKIFSIAVLLSSCFLYNSVGSIDQQSIDRLGVVLRLCEHLKENPQQSIDQSLPNFYWILRDFSLILADENNQPISPDNYLKRSLQDQKGEDSGTKTRNKIRQSIIKSFGKKYCQCFVRPLVDQNQLQNLSKMKLEQLRPQFVEQVLQFRKNFSENLKVKKMKKKQLRGQQISQLIKVYTEAINKNFENDQGGIPMIQNGWKCLMKRQLQSVFQEIEIRLNNIINKIIKQDPKGQKIAQIPKNKKELTDLRGRIMQDLEKNFRKKLSNQHIQNEIKYYIQQISNSVTKKMKIFQQQIKKISQTETKKFINQNYQKSIDERIKSGQIKQFAELFQQSNTFLSFVRQRCPYKQEINQIGLPLVLKKFQQSAFKLNQIFQKDKEKSVDQLNDKFQALKTQLNEKQTKFKKQKDALIKKVAISSSKIDQMQRKAQQLNNQLEKYKFDGNNKNLSDSCNSGVCSSSQKLQKTCHQNLSLRRKIMQLEQTHNDQTVLLKQKISDYEKQFALRQGLVKQKSQTLNTLKQQLFNIQNENKKMKQEFQKQINNYLNSEKQTQKYIETLKQEFQKIKHQLHQKNNQLDRIRILIGQKTKQIGQLQIELKQKNKIIQEKQQKRNKYSQDDIDEMQELRNKMEDKKFQLQEKLRKLQQQSLIKEQKLKNQFRQTLKQAALQKQNLTFQIQNLEEKQIKLKRLQQQSNNFGQIFNQKDEQIEKLKKEFVQYHEQREAHANLLVDEIKLLNSQICQLKSQIGQKQDQKNNNINSLNKQIKSFQKQNKQLKQEIEKNHQNIEKLKKNINELENCIEKIKTENEQIIQEIKSEQMKQKYAAQNRFQANILELKNFYNMSEQKLKQQIIDQKRKLEEKQNQFKQQLEIKITEIQLTYEEQIQAMKKQYSQKLFQYQEQTKNQKTQIQQRTQQVNQQKNKLITLYQSTQKKIQQLNQKLAQAQNIRTQENLQLLTQVQKNTNMIASKDLQIQTLKKRIQENQQQMKKNKKKTDADKQNMKRQIQKLINDLQKQKFLYKEAINNFSQEKSSLSTQLSLALQQIEFTQIKLNERQKMLNQKSYETQADLGQYENKIKIFKEQKNKLKSQVKALEKQKQVFLARNVQLEKKINELQEKKNKDQQQLSKQLSQVQKIYNNKMSSLKKIKEKHKQDYEFLKNKSQREICQLKTEIQNYKKAVNSLRNYSDDLRHEKQKNQALNKQIIKKLEQQVKDKQNQNEQLMKKNEENIENFKKISSHKDQISSFKRFLSPDLKRSNVSSNGLGSSRFTTQLQQIKQSGANKKIIQLEQSLKKSKQNEKIYKSKVETLQTFFHENERKIETMNKFKQRYEQKCHEFQRFESVKKNQIQNLKFEFKRKFDQIQRETRKKDQQINFGKVKMQTQQMKAKKMFDQHEQQIRKLKEQIKNYINLLNQQHQQQETQQQNNSGSTQSSFQLRKSKIKSKFGTISGLNSNFSTSMIRNQNKTSHSTLNHSNSINTFGFGGKSKYTQIWDDSNGFGNLQ